MATRSLAFDEAAAFRLLSWAAWLFVLVILGLLFQNAYQDSKRADAWKDLSLVSQSQLQDHRRVAERHPDDLAGVIVWERLNACTPAELERQFKARLQAQGYGPFTQEERVGLVNAVEQVCLDSVLNPVALGNARAAGALAYRLQAAGYRLSARYAKIAHDDPEALAQMQETGLFDSTLPPKP